MIPNCNSFYGGAVPDSPDGLFALDNGDILISDKINTHQRPQCIIPLDVVRRLFTEPH
jgi:hypothetical protein